MNRCSLLCLAGCVTPFAHDPRKYLLYACVVQAGIYRKELYVMRNAMRVSLYLGAMYAIHDP